MNHTSRNTLFGCVLCLILASFYACSAHAMTDSDIFTLYRNSIVGAKMRIHVATFDSDIGEDYNQENCFLAATLFKNQPVVKVHHWCEKGRPRK